MDRKEIIDRASGNRETIQHLIAALERVQATAEENRNRQAERKIRYDHETVVQNIRSSILELALCDIPGITEEEIDILLSPTA